MSLKTTSELRISGSSRVTRLSYIFEDDDGWSTGVTSAWMSPVAIPDKEVAIREDPSIWLGRPQVIADGTEVGLLNPGQGINASYFPAGHESEPSILGPGALTCSFMLSATTNFDNNFRRVADPADGRLESVTGQDIHILGEGSVGTISERMEYSRVLNRVVYPLLRLDRHHSDRSRSHVGVRNGAMITTARGTLVGVIVGISQGGEAYSIAPISDVLQWHRLRFLRDLDAKAEPVKERRRAVPRVEALPERVDPRFNDLMAA